MRHHATASLITVGKRGLMYFSPAKALTAILLLVFPLLGWSQSPYPNKPIRLIVISAPGGTTDIIARTFSQYAGEGLQQQIVPDNRPGAGGLIAGELTATAPADGYTLLLTHTSHAVLPSLHEKMPYDPVADFAPIGLIALFPGVLIVNNALAAKSVKELIALAKLHPGKINFATGTTGATAHLSGQSLKKMANIDIVQIPYKGTAAALTALLSGEVQFTFASLPAALPYINSGRVRALAMGSAKRAAALPDLPTVAEAGLPGFDVSAWNGILAPKGTPRAIILKINQQLQRIVQIPAAKERAAGQGAELFTDTPEAFTAHIRSQIVKWSKVVKASDMRID